jgi:DNA polymerase III alpha subunit
MHKIGGLTMAETNVFRKVVSKKFRDAKKEEERMKKLSSYKQKFIEIASKPENIGNIKKCEELWSLIENMATYAFNAAHSVSYTYISFREFWLKTYYDLEYNVSLLNHSDLESSVGYVTSMIGKGYKISYPNINKSQKYFSIFENDIVWGLSNIKGIPDKIVDEIIEERKNGLYESVEQLFNRVKISNSVAECLVWSGTLNELKTNQEPDIFGNMLYEINDRYSLSDYIQKSILKNKKFEKKKDTIINIEKEYLKISFEEILKFVNKKIELMSKTNINIIPIHECEKDGVYNIFGSVKTIQKKKTVSGKDFFKITVGDESGTMTGVMIWPWKNNIKVEKNKFYYAKIQIKDGFKNLVSCSEIV